MWHPGRHSAWHSAHAIVRVTHCGIQNMSIWHSDRHSTWHSAHATQCDILHMPLNVAFRTYRCGILTVTRRGILHISRNVTFARRLMWHSKCRNWCHYTIQGFRNEQQKQTARWTRLSTAHQLLWNRSKMTSPLCFCGKEESTLVLRATFSTQGVPNQVSKLP